MLQTYVSLSQEFFIVWAVLDFQITLSAMLMSEEFLFNCLFQQTYIRNPIRQAGISLPKFLSISAKIHLGILETRHRKESILALTHRFHR